MSSKVLSHDLFGKKGKRAAVWMHGILGHKRNLRQISQRLLKHNNEIIDCSITAEHRGHGFSHGPHFKTPHTVRSCANDLSHLITSLDVKPVVLVAHSFGGKVSIEYLKNQLEKTKANNNNDNNNNNNNDNDNDNDNNNILNNLPKHIWILDSLPGPYNDSGGEESVINVMKILRKLPSVFESRKWMMKTLVHDYQIPEGIAMWLCTSVVSTEDKKGSKFMFDIELIHDLFEDFLHYDLFPWLEEYAENGNELYKIDTNSADSSNSNLPTIHFLRAGKSPQWTPQVYDRLNSLTYAVGGGQITLNTIKDAGHWLHTSHPTEVVQYIDRSLDLLRGRSLK